MLNSRHLWVHRALLSAKRRGSPTNAVAEAIFSTLKTTEVKNAPHKTHQQVKTGLFNYLVGFHKAKLRHSSLGCLSPNDFERALFAKAA